MLQEKTSPSPSASVFSSREMIFPPSTPTTTNIIVKPTPLSVSTTSSWSSSTSSAYMLSPLAKPPSPPIFFPSSSSAFQPASHIKTKLFADQDPASTQISALTTSQLTASDESVRSITPITELVSNPENASKLREAIHLLQASYHGVIAELERQTKEAQSLHESYVQVLNVLETERKDASKAKQELQTVVHHNKKLHLVCNAVGPAAEKLQKMVDKLLPHVRNSQMKADVEAELAAVQNILNPNPLLLSSSSAEEIPRTKSISVNDSAQSSLMAALISPTKRNVRGKLSAKFVQQARQRSFNNANTARPAKDVRFNSIPLHLHTRDINGVSRAQTQAILDSPRRKQLKINPVRESAESKSNHKRSLSIDSNISDASTVTLDEAEINAQRDLHPHTTDGCVHGLTVSHEARMSTDILTSASTSYRMKDFDDEKISTTSEDKRMNVVASGNLLQVFAADPKYPSGYQLKSQAEIMRLRKITHLRVVTTSTQHSEQFTKSFVYLCGLSSSSSPDYDPATPTVTVLVYDINDPTCLLLHSSCTIHLPKPSSALKSRKRSCSMMEEMDAEMFSKVQTLAGTIGERSEITVILKFENGVIEKRVCNAALVNGDHR